MGSYVGALDRAPKGSAASLSACALPLRAVSCGVERRTDDELEVAPFEPSATALDDGGPSSGCCPGWQLVFYLSVVAPSAGVFVVRNLTGPS